jgi:hypothetical protein
MFIIWGTSVRKRPIGRVADYCPWCRDARPFRIIRHSHHRHIYFIQVSRSHVDGHSRQCEQCGEVLAVDPAQYQSLGGHRKASLDALINQTNPGLKQQVAAAADLRRRAERGELAPEERLTALSEPLALLEMAISRRAERTHTDLWGGLSLLMLGIAPAIGLLIPRALFLDNAAHLIGFAIGTVAGLVTCIVVMSTDVRRFTRRKIRHELIPSLAPLRPAESELNQLLEAMRMRAQRLPRYLDPMQLAQDVEAYVRGRLC